VNVVFISPNFPPNYYLFPARLREEGATVLGIGDAPWEALRPELQAVLGEYVRVPDMNQQDAMVRALGYLTWKHGKIDRLDSNNEHWLPLEARLRRAFNVPGQKPEDTEVNRSKSRMKQRFLEAGIPCGPGEPLRDGEHARAFAKAHGYPLVVKPDVGVGAGGALKVQDEAGLERALARLGEGLVIEKFLQGELYSFDGLTDESGRIAFCTSHVFNDGIMEVVTGLGPMHYYSLRELPADLERVGRATVEAFAIRGRFFHIEFFRLADGGLRALEVNVRPPGGFTTDMMNFATDGDVYRLWARIVTGQPLPAEPLTRKFHVAHASRRYHLRYALAHEALLARLGALCVLHTEMAAALSGAMGDYVYLLRTADLAELQAAIADVERAG
jgi:hypothetical protein